MLALLALIGLKKFRSFQKPNRIDVLEKKTRRLGAGPETPCFLFQHVYPIRLLEAAELLEADQRKQRKHEGGHSKETSSGFDRTSFGSVPRATPDFPKLRTWPWNLCWAEAFVNMAVDKCQ